MPGTSSDERTGSSDRRSRPLDLDDPDWVPIHGVTLDRYVQLSTQLARARLDALETWLEQQGVSRGTWAEIDAGWTRRIVHREVVRSRYGHLRDR